MSFPIDPIPPRARDFFAYVQGMTKEEWAEMEWYLRNREIDETDPRYIRMKRALLDRDKRKSKIRKAKAKKMLPAIKTAIAYLAGILSTVIAQWLISKLGL